MLTYRTLLDSATKTLYEATDTPRIDAEFLMQHAVGQSMAWIISYGDSPAATEHIKTFNRLIDERANGVPVAYLMGHKEFWTLKLKVNSSVLIPRGDTEVLVEQALERISATAKSRVLDLGTGSGAIALSVAKERPEALVLAVDKHAEAIEVAQKNAKLNEISNVEFAQSDWYSTLADERFDLVLSNPPYVAPNDEHLSRGDLRFEPVTALVAGNSGMADLNQIIEGARSFLKPNGWLILEHGYQQHQAVANKLRESGFVNLSLYADLNQLPRCTAAQWRP